MIVPINCIISTLAFSIRSYAQNKSYTATLFINGVQSSFSATIIDGSTSFNILQAGNLALNAQDLISLQITFDNGGALSYGICASLLVSV